MRYPTQTPVGNRNTRLLKYFSLLLSTLCTVTIATGCGGFSDKEARAFYKKAVPIGQKYFQEHYRSEERRVEKEIKVPMSSTIVLNGHVKDDPQTWVSLSLYLPSLEIK